MQPAGQSPTMRLGMAMPEKLSRLRRKPGQKAKQEPKFRFYSIPHDKLMACLRMRIADRSVLKLIRMWLKSPVVEPLEEKGGEGKGGTSRKGTPQGGVISPLLSNLYLHYFDKVFHKPNGPAHWANARLVRYADDFVVLARYQGARLTGWIESRPESWMGLEINREKTRVVNLRHKGQTLDFLGFTFRFNRSLYEGKRYLNVFPSDNSIARGRGKLRELTARRRGCLPIPRMVRDVNRHLKGWGDYFDHGYPRKTFREINAFVNQRLRAHLKRRSQRPFRPPEGRTMHEHLKKPGLVTL
ncbi:MAG: hypothetical protein JRI22_15460 [Deltaproteobacteria bacterium]|nr:hypothetical protein [Deltaproteobacteria bacterium]